MVINLDAWHVLAIYLLELELAIVLTWRLVRHFKILISLRVAFCLQSSIIKNSTVS